jgi:hypothetical protein
MNYYTHYLNSCVLKSRNADYNMSQISTKRISNASKYENLSSKSIIEESVFIEKRNSLEKIKKIKFKNENIKNVLASEALSQVKVETSISLKTISQKKWENKEKIVYKKLPFICKYNNERKIGVSIKQTPKITFSKKLKKPLNIAFMNKSSLDTLKQTLKFKENVVPSPKRVYFQRANDRIVEGKINKTYSKGSSYDVRVNIKNNTTKPKTKNINYSIFLTDTSCIISEDPFEEFHRKLKEKRFRLEQTLSSVKGL